MLAGNAELIGAPLALTADEGGDSLSPVLPKSNSAFHSENQGDS